MVNKDYQLNLIKTGIRSRAKERSEVYRECQRVMEAEERTVIHRLLLLLLLQT